MYVETNTLIYEFRIQMSNLKSKLNIYIIIFIYRNQCVELQIYK